MSDAFLTDDELKEQYGVGYKILVKMGWTPDCSNTPVYKGRGCRGNDTNSRFGLGFVKEHDNKLDTEFEDMLNKMAKMTTKLPNPKANTRPSGKDSTKPEPCKPTSCKQSTSNGTQVVVKETDLKKVKEKCQTVTDTAGFSGLKWSELDEQSALPKNSFSPVKMKIQLKKRTSKVCETKLNIFE